MYIANSHQVIADSEISRVYSEPITLLALLSTLNFDILFTGTVFYEFF
jgi:hypothetical protein